jgi:hypothetical protein
LKAIRARFPHLEIPGFESTSGTSQIAKRSLNSVSTAANGGAA